MPGVIHLPGSELRSKIKVEKNSEGYSSGQRGQTVNLLAYAFGGSNPPPSTSTRSTTTRLTTTRFIGFTEPVPVCDARVARPIGVPRRAGVVQW